MYNNLYTTRVQRAKGVTLRTIIAIPADTHCGSSVGLMPERWQTKEDYYIHASDMQREVLLYQWRMAWDAIRQERKRSRLIVVVNGDPVDGNHHATEQLVTQNIGEQQRIFVNVMQEALDTAKFSTKKGDRLYCTTGTSAHGGYTSEEATARLLNSTPHTPPKNGNDGRFAWPRLRLSVNGQIIDIAHQGAGVGSRAWTKTNTMMYTIKSIYYESLEASKKPPRFYVRSHRHKWITPQDFTGNHGKITGFITPAMQLKTDFAHKVAGDEILSTVGVAWLVIEDDERLSRVDASLYEYEDETALEVIE